ncbi:MAG: Nif11-like leader peptide family natural product precursor [Chlorobiaceae bacterium]|nr:Nif11-like leader peptide family natural product precursor [Chlorobiaceae bacterium]
MSVADAKACIEKLKSDEAFRKRIMSIEGSDARLQAIQGAGFSCSLEEIQQANTEIGNGDDVVGGEDGGYTYWSIC